MKKIFILAALMILMVLPLAEGGMYFDSYLLDRERGVPTTDWYDVADWEVGFCMSWGGLDSVDEESLGSMSNADSYITHNNIITLQAEKNSIIPSSNNIELIASGAVVYEVGWFIRPFEEEDMNFEIKLVTNYGFAEILVSGSTNYYNPERGYEAFETEANFTIAHLRYWNEKIDGELEVPIV